MENSAPVAAGFINQVVETPMHGSDCNNNKDSSDSEDSVNLTPFDQNKHPKKKRKKNYF